MSAPGDPSLNEKSIVSRQENVWIPTPLEATLHQCARKRAESFHELFEN